MVQYRLSLKTIKFRCGTFRLEIPDKTKNEVQFGATSEKRKKITIIKLFCFVRQNNQYTIETYLVKTR